MNIIEPYIEILSMREPNEILSNLEKYGRVCYKSENKIKEGSAAKRDAPAGSVPLPYCTEGERGKKVIGNNYKIK